MQNNWFNRLRANIFGTDINRVEHDVNGSWWMMTDNTAFANRQQMFWYSVNNPILCAVLTTRAQLFSQMKITHLRNGDEVKNSSIVSALRNPNYFQSQKDWLFSLNWLAGTYGTGLIYYNTELLDSSVPKFLYNLDNSKIDFGESLKMKKFIRLKQDVTEFEKRKIKYSFDDGNQSDIELRNILPFYDTANGIDGVYLGVNRMGSILGALDNIQSNIESKNINLEFSKKYIGVNKTDLHGSPQITDQDRANIKRAVGSKHVQITNGNIEFSHLVSDFKKLFLDEMYQADAMTVINAYGLNIDVINYALNNSTFSNQELGIIRVIQNNIQVQADNLMETLQQGFQMPDNESLIASYDHLPVMQSMLKDKIDVLSNGIDAINKAKESGLLSESEAKEKAKRLLDNLKL